MKIVVPVKRKTRIEMLPLIDVIFLLLVFFIYAFLSMAVHRGLTVSLPSSNSTDNDISSLLSITVKADGLLLVDDQVVPMDELRNYLAEKKNQNQKETGVLIFADRELPYQRLFDVLDQVRAAGINVVSLQADAKAKP